MKFEGAGFAAGFITAAGIILVVIFAFQLDIFVDTPICAGDENGLTCARNWANAVAILAAAGTIFFLAREQEQARIHREEDRREAIEAAVLSSLPVRAALRMATDRGTRLQNQVDALEVAADRLLSERYTAMKHAKPHEIIHYLKMCLRILDAPEWLEAAKFEGSLIGKLEQAGKNTALFLELIFQFKYDRRTILEGNPSDEYISEEWREYLKDDIFKGCLADLRTVIRSAQSIAEALDARSLSEFFSNEQTTERNARRIPR